MPLLRAALSWNFVLATAICASLLAQLIKVILNLFIFHRFIAERMWGAGGMPSSHSATVCAMVVATGRYCGVNSPIFAIAAVLSIIVMYLSPIHLSEPTRRTPISYAVFFLKKKKH